MPYRLEKRTYATADGELVDENDERAAVLVGAEGAEIPDDVAARYGLVNGDAPVVVLGNEPRGVTIEDGLETLRRQLPGEPKHDAVDVDVPQESDAKAVRDTEAEDKAVNQPARARKNG